MLFCLPICGEQIPLEILLFIQISVQKQLLPLLTTNLTIIRIVCKPNQYYQKKKHQGLQLYLIKNSAHSIKQNFQKISFKKWSF